MTRSVRRRIPALKMRRSYTSATGLTLRGQVHIEDFILIFLNFFFNSFQCLWHFKIIYDFS